jgi:hypothetical protein
MRRDLLVTLAGTIAVAASVVACPRHEDVTPQIAVSPNAAGRIGLIPSRAGTRPQASANARAKAHPLRAGEELGGPNATGRAGDWVLENDEVVFVVDALGAGGGFAESGGNLVDAADAKVRKDELGQVFTYFGTFPRQGVYEALDAREEPDGTAVLVARGKELWEPSIEVVTEYRLAGADRALLLRTTLTNKGDERIEGLGLGDAIQWGGAEKLAPGKAVGFKGPSKGPFLGAVGRFTSYAITSTEGEIAAISGAQWSDTEQKKGVTLEPGAAVTYERVFVVGQRADSASIVTELTRAAGGDVGALEVVLVDAAGKRVVAPAGAKVVLGTRPQGASDPSARGGDVMSLVAAKPSAEFGGEVVPGTWTVAYAASAGRRGLGPKVEVTVKKGVTTEVQIPVSDVAQLSAGCVESKRVPCKITVEGLEGTASPDFGPAHVAAAAKNQLFSATEDATVDLAPGKYRLTASRGPEYETKTAELVLAPGASAQKTFALRRVVDTSGYVSTDFHQHTMLSADAPVATRDRAVSNAVEGLEVAVASEHNVVVDLGPVVRELGLSPFHVSIPGDELTSDASRKPWGHANVFPLVPAPGKARGGAVAVRDRTAKEALSEIRAMPGTRVVQVNHPRSGSNGYFDLLGFDPKTGVGTAPGYDPGFDALEVWNGHNVDGRDKTLGDFFALLRTGHPVTAVGDTDTHGIVGQESGYPRTFVRVARDDALDAWDEKRTEDLVRAVRSVRDVVVTNGPFLRVTANGAGIGGVARANAGVVEVKVHVASAPHVAVERLELRTAGGARPVGDASVAVAPKPSASGALEADATFRLRAAQDDAFVVIATGSKPMRPVLSGDDKEIVPWAMTGAIWIDADGDGKSLGR